MVENIQSRDMRRVLVIAYSFPPAGGGRVRRALKFVKYLGDFGWEPVVLTAQRPVVSAYDDDLLKQVNSNIRIIRTPVLEPGKGIKNLVGNGRSCGSGGNSFRNIVSRLLKGLGSFIFVPDTRIGWVPFILFYGFKAVKKYDIKAILIIGEPNSSFIGGILLKLFCKKPAILDFRDEWTELNKHFFPDKVRLVKKAEELLERFVVKYADRVISVTQPIIETFKNRYPQYSDKFVCITNGFDPEDYKNIEPVVLQKHKLVITYAGSLYKLRSPEYFLRALEELFARCPESRESLEVIFIGTIEPDIRELINQSSVKSVIRMPGFIKYKEALRYMVSSSILLYIEDQAEIGYRFLPAKLFDYIGVRKPILALASDGVVKFNIMRLNCGFTAPSFDVHEISLVLERLYNMHKSQGLACNINERVAQEFNRRKLTGDLACLLNSIV